MSDSPDSGLRARCFATCQRRSIHSPWWRFPPGRLWHSLLAGLMLVLLWVELVPADRTYGFVVAPIVLLMGLIWLVRFIGSIDPQRLRDGWRWLLAPGVVLATFILFALHIPSRTRFAFARDDFDAVVSDLEPRGTFDGWVGLRVPGRIGSYTALAAYQIGENVLIEIEGQGFSQIGGFAYLPVGEDDRLVLGELGVNSFSNLGDGWYRWTVTLD